MKGLVVSTHENWLTHPWGLDGRGWERRVGQRWGLHGGEDDTIRRSPSAHLLLLSGGLILAGKHRPLMFVRRVRILRAFWQFRKLMIAVRAFLCGRRPYDVTPALYY